MARVIPNIALALGLIGFAATPAFASYAIFVGSNLTADGSTLLGGTGDEPSSHWLEIVPHRSWPAESFFVGRARGVLLNSSVNALIMTLNNLPLAHSHT